jgi:hypothetical protein
MRTTFFRWIGLGAAVFSYSSGCRFIAPGDELIPCAVGDECAFGQTCQGGFCRPAQGPGDGGIECGDGFCEIGETALSCAADCFDFDPEDAVCGDDFCEIGETRTNCPDDCEIGAPGDDVCGNDVCEAGETDANCPFDCQDDGDPFICGDGMCDAGESLNCPTDCNTDVCSPTCVSDVGCDDNDPCTNDDCIGAPGRCGPVSICRHEPIDCPFGQECVNGMCQGEAFCFTDADCGFGGDCVNGVCSP